jgi:hypothetical protein
MRSSPVAHRGRDVILLGFEERTVPVPDNAQAAIADTERTLTARPERLGSSNALDWMTVDKGCPLSMNRVEWGSMSTNVVAAGQRPVEAAGRRVCPLTTNPVVAGCEARGRPTSLTTDSPAHDPGASMY